MSLTSKNEESPENLKSKSAIRKRQSQTSLRASCDSTEAKTTKEALERIRNDEAFIRNKEAL